jgi:hypothetical protein
MSDVAKALKAAALAAGRVMYPGAPIHDVMQLEPDDMPAIRAAIVAFLRAMPGMVSSSNPKWSGGYYYNTPGRIIAEIEKLNQ